MIDLKKKDIVYYTRILPTSGIYDILELQIRTVEKDWFVGIEKLDKQAFLFNNDQLDKTVFKDRNIALKIVQEAEKYKSVINNDSYYEEY